MSPAQAVRALRAARASRTPITPFTDAEPALDADWGYSVQDLDRDERVREGEIIIGAKLGLTSRAKQERMHVSEPIVGFLSDTYQFEPADLGDYLGGWAQPRIEPEIAFLTSRDITNPLSRADAILAVEMVTLAAEIIDSRYVGYRFRLPDVVADNTSAAGMILGHRRVRPRDAGDLAALRCRVAVDEQVVHQATGAAILGDPVLALVRLSTHLARHGRTLPAGSWVLAGALTDAVGLAPGHRYQLEIEKLGQITLP